MPPRAVKIVKIENSTVSRCDRSCHLGDIVEKSRGFESDIMRRISTTWTY